MATNGLEDVFVYVAIFLFFFFVLKYLLGYAHEQNAKPRAVVKQDDFYKDFGYSYDFVFVFEVYPEDEMADLSKFQQQFSMKNIIDRLIKSGIEYKCFYSCQRDEVYVKLRVSPSRLKEEADRIDYKLKLNPDRLKLKAQSGKPGRWNKIIITDEYNQSPYEPWDYIYAKYDQAPELQSLYEQYEADNNRKHPFREVDRIKLMLSIMAAKTYENGCGFHLSNLIVKKSVLAAFPIHNYDYLIELQRKWLILYQYPWHMPVDQIKDYFGERIGLYFVFLGYYTTALMFPALVGAIIFAIQKAYIINRGVSEYEGMPVFATVMVIWSTFFIEGWKREQITTALKWGVVGFESEEQDRPQFFGLRINSPIDGKPMVYFEEHKKQRRHNIVTACITLAIIIVVIVVAATFAVQVIMNQPQYVVLFTIRGFNATSIIISIINAVTIAVLNILYGMVVYQLNDYENHRTDTDYEDSLVSKIFVFQVVNSFAALTYVGFVKDFLSFAHCTNNNCTGDVATTLSTVFMSRQLVIVIVEVFVRLIMQYLKTQEETSGLEPGVRQSPIEEQYVLAEYDVLIGAMQDYTGIVIQYGYMILFVAAFPLSTTLAFVTCYLQIRIDGWKLCQAFRRPLPKSAEDIGTWQDMLSILSLIAVLFNFGLIFFTGNYLENITWEFRWIILLIAQNACFILRLALDMFIDDVPEYVQMQLDRQEFLVGKVIENKDDEQDDEVSSSVDGSVNIIIDQTDLGWVLPLDGEDEEDEDDDIELLEGGMEQQVV